MAAYEVRNPVGLEILHARDAGDNRWELRSLQASLLHVEWCRALSADASAKMEDKSEELMKINTP